MDVFYKPQGRGLARVLDLLFAVHWREAGARRWTFAGVAFAWLCQALSRGATLDERFGEARGWLCGLFRFARLPAGATYQGFVKALRKRPALPAWVAAVLGERTREWAGSAWTVAGWVPLAMDGTRFDAPRSRSCQRRLGRAARAKSAPQLVLTSLWHLGAHCWADLRIAAATVGERTLVRDMLAGLPERTLLVGDAGFAGYDFCQEIKAAGAAFLLRVGNNVRLLEGLGDRRRGPAGLVHLWPEAKARRGLPPLALRLIAAGRGRRRAWLVTSVLDPRALSKRQAREFYRRRWGVETAYRSVKQTLARRAVRSRAADLAGLELLGVIFGHWLLAALALRARGAKLAGRAWSTARAAAALRRHLHPQRGGGERGTTWQQDLRAAALAPAGRRGRKKTRQDWAKVKHDPPCGAPAMLPATPFEHACYKRFMCGSAL